MLQDVDGKYCVEVVKTTTQIDHTHQYQQINIDHTPSSNDGIRYIYHRHYRYLYQTTVGKFVLLQGLDIDHTLSDLHQMKSGLLLEQHALRYTHNYIIMTSFYIIYIIQEDVIW